MVRQFSGHRIHQLDDDQDGALLAVVYGAVFQFQEEDMTRDAVHEWAGQEMAILQIEQPGRLVTCAALVGQVTGVRALRFCVTSAIGQSRAISIADLQHGPGETGKTAWAGSHETASAVPPQWADPGRVEQPPPLVAKVSEVHPLSLWPLDEREAEGRQAAVIFLSNVTLPCSSGYDLFGAVSFSVSTVLNKEKEIKGDKIRKQVHGWKGQSPDDLVAGDDTRVEEDPWNWVSGDPFPSMTPEAPIFVSEQRLKGLWLEHDPVAKSIVGCIDVMAGPWANQKAQDFAALLDFLAMPAPDILLRWAVPSAIARASVHYIGIPTNRTGQKEKAALRQAHNPSTTETATRRLVVAVAKRCASYHILTEESLKDEQTVFPAVFAMAAADHGDCEHKDEDGRGGLVEVVATLQGSVASL
ncbi:hypothetical protein AK812_SmicGene6639 [Symbiodinium microadriaticum]|uniref:Uncharacterized protein n=1 Tax=Symbiodinium microadriaticum TaxID=2951 RepID=A0A1Q9EQN0_SYMMI|nr:hypothetical protein AK812_SmicGene6639 [Symbiodinium microadriaticum]